MLKEDGAEPRLIPILGYKPLIGVVHLPPLNTERRRGDDIDHLIEYAVSEAVKLEESGFDAIIVENFGDGPYHMDPGDDKLLIATMAVIVREIARRVKMPAGVNVLRNAATSSLAVAYSSGAHFIRVNSYCETRLTPEGLMEPAGAAVEDMRSRLPRYVAVFADVDVKHSWGMAPVEESVKECVVRGSMDALIVSGSRTGAAPPPGYVASIRALAGNKPIIIGSGVSYENIVNYWAVADGFIVGTSIKLWGTRSPISVEKAAKLAQKVKELRSGKDIPLGGRFLLEQ